MTEKKREMKQNPCSREAMVFWIGCAIGAVVFIMIYGVDILRFTNDTWLLHSDDLEGSIDLTQHYLGWVFYRRTPWRFPLGLTQGIYWDNVSVVYTDSIPLFALFFKLLSPLLPETFQYFGLFGICCYALTGGFGAMLIGRFCDGKAAPLLASVLFCLSPVMLNRMYLHTALAAHFLLVAALVIWAYSDSMTQKKKILYWSLLLTTGTLINAYFTPMILGTMLCAYLQDVLRKANIKKIAVSAAVPLTVTLLAGYAVGMFYGNVPAAGGGLELLSFNLDAFVNPMTYLSHYGKRTFTPDEFRAFNYSSILPSLPLYSNYQNEGFAYLGLGVILLLTISLVLVAVIAIGKGKKHEKLLSKSAVLPIALYLAVFLLLALSPKWTLGSRELLNLPYPDAVRRGLSVFRSTGRFIWPVYYMLLAAAFILPLKLMKGKRGGITVLLLILTAVQAIDLYPGMVEKKEAFAGITPYESRLASDGGTYHFLSADIAGTIF